MPKQGEGGFAMSDDRIRDEIARDLRPVRPLWSWSRRVLVLVPLAIAIVVGLPLVQYFRTDMSALGFFKAWGLSIIEASAGVVIVGLGLRESVPGRSLKTRGVVLTAALGLAVPLVVWVVTADTFGLGPQSWSELQYGAERLRA